MNYTRSYDSTITKTYLYNFDPLKPHFYIVKLGFTGVYIIFLISAQNIDCGYSLEPPRRGGSNEYPQSMFCAEIWKISEFLSEKFQFLEIKFSIYLNRHVFVMTKQRQKKTKKKKKKKKKKTNAKASYNVIIYAISHINGNFSQTVNGRNFKAY